MPKGQFPRFKKVQQDQSGSTSARGAQEPSKLQTAEFDSPDPLQEIVTEPVIPLHWSKGALLNVRNTGPDYCVTLYPEEFDPRHPERAMRFTNPAHCQNFVSNWYSRQSYDPRAR